LYTPSTDQFVKENICDRADQSKRFFALTDEFVSRGKGNEGLQTETHRHLVTVMHTLADCTGQRCGFVPAALLD
jgi:hypothetical protein